MVRKIATMISPDTMITITQLMAESYSKKEAARILDIDVPTMMALEPILKMFPGYRQARIGRSELMRMLDKLGVRFRPDTDEENMNKLPPKTRLRLERLRAELG